ncbi:nSTAND1 domain-containing NTPase [Geodermatophilus sp. SYSU D00700]
MRIAVLGPLEVRGEDGAPVPVPGAKERLLLAVLAAGAPGVVSTDRIAEELWDGDPPASARKSLQAHLVRLRSALEPDRPRGSTGRHVVRRGPGYALAVERADLDALALADLAARGRAALAAGDPAAAAELLCAARDLWRGDPYADWPDAAFAQAERRRLTELRDGVLTALAEARLALGEAAALVPELERMVAEQPLHEEWWRLLVLALYRAGRQADALGAARRARAVLAEELGADPGPALRAVEAAVLAQDPALDPVPAPAPVPPPAPASGACPYMGLRAYRAEDASLFAGRERLVATLVARLVDAPLLAVSGPSGAGKSSVVRAGLVPALAAGALPHSAGWQPLVLLPGRRPVDALADLTAEDPPPRPVLLVCDQFEELWAPGVDPAERTAFLDTVLALLDDGAVARCVVVVRGDAVGRLAEHPGFVDRLGAALVLVPPMSDPELRAVVRDPAAAVGLRAEDDLVDAVVADGLGRPGALPLLSAALVATWERRRGDLLTLAGYVSAGGVAGALARSAEVAYAALDEPGRELARRLFVRLADVDDAGALVRRPLPTADLGTDGARRAVVEEFLARRLLSVDADRLEVTHEALLTAWPRLARWLEEDAAGRAVRRHLTPAARDWDRAGRPDDELYRGARLTAALDWAAGAGDEPTPVERAFIDASRAAADAELEAAHRRADREAAARRRTRSLAVGLAAVLVAVLLVAVVAVRAQRDAQRASLVADANRLAALSTTAGRLDVSLLLAAQAERLADTPETQDALLTAVLAHQRAVRAVPVPGRVRGGVLAGGGRSLFLGVGSELVTWEVGPTSLPRAVEGLEEWGGWRAAAASPVDDVIVGFGATEVGPWVRRADVAGADRLLLSGDEVGGTPVAGSFTADGRQVQLLVVADAGGGEAPAAEWAVTVLDPGTGTRLESRPGGSLPIPPDQVLGHVAGDHPAAAVLWAMDEPLASLVGLADASGVPVQWQSRDARTTAFRALASGAAQLWDDGAVTLYDRTGRPVQLLTGHQQTVRDVAVSPDGRWAATVGDGAAVVVWDVDPATGRWTRRESLPGHDADVVEAFVDGTGSRLFTASVDDTVVEWDMAADGGLGGTYPPLPDRYVSNRPQLVEPEGLLVAPTRAVGADPGVGEDPIDRLAPRPDTRSVAAAFLDPATGEVVDQVVVGDTLEGASHGSSVAVSPDGRTVAVTSGLATTVLDTRTRDELTRIALEPTGDTDLQGEPLTAEPVWCAGWTPDGSRLLLCAEGRLGSNLDGGLVVVEVGSWQRLDRLEIGAPQSIEASPDGSRLAVAHAGAAELVVLDARTLEIDRILPLAEDDRLYDLSFSPDGRRLAAGGELGLVHVLDTGSWEWSGDPVDVHDDAVLQVEWLPDDRTAVTAGADGRVSLFDTARQLVRARPLPASTEPGEGFAHLVPGAGDELVALGGERPGRRYPLDPSAWLDRACAVVGRDLTAAEWDRYLPDREWAPTCTDLG